MYPWPSFGHPEPLQVGEVSSPAASKLLLLLRMVEGSARCATLSHTSIELSIWHGYHLSLQCVVAL